MSNDERDRAEELFNGQPPEFDIEVVMVDTGHGLVQADPLTMLKAEVISQLVTTHRNRGHEAVVAMLEEAEEQGITLISVTAELVKVLSNCMREARGI